MGPKIVNAKTSKLLGSDTHAAELIGSAPVDTHSAQLDGDAGSDTHAASLTGSSSNAEDNAQAEQSVTGTVETSSAREWGLSGNSGDIVATFTDIVSPADSMIILVAGMARSEGQGGIKTFIWKKDGINYLSTFTLPSTTRQIVRVQVQIAVSDAGTHTYTLVETTSASYGAVTAKVTFVQITDTHAASLTGSAPVDTHSASLQGSAGSDTHAASLTGSNTQKARPTGIIS